MSTANRQDNRQQIEYEDDGGEILHIEQPPDILEQVLRATRHVHAEESRKYPRKVELFMTRVRELLNLDPEIAEECTYVLPRTKNTKEIDPHTGRVLVDPRTGKPVQVPITGKSIRFAELLMYGWGNISLRSTILGDDGKYVTAEATGVDGETNNEVTMQAVMGITTSGGRRYNDDGIKNAMMGAQAKAQRNVLLKLIPDAVSNVLWKESQNIALGTKDMIPEKTQKAVAFFASKGVSVDRVWKALDIAGPQEMTLDLLANLRGMVVSMREGHATLDDLFPTATAASTTTPPADKPTLTERIKGQGPKGKDETSPPLDTTEAGSGG